MGRYYKTETFTFQNYDDFDSEMSKYPKNWKFVKSREFPIGHELGTRAHVTFLITND